jgi:predicted N-formylglutamate amidohydrolase
VVAARRRRAAADTFYLVTCEHGGNRIPPRYGPIFRRYRSLLESHRGYDVGALTMARELARALRAPLVASTVSRLLVDLNRSRGHRTLHSEASAALPAEEKARVLARYYEPYRAEVERHVAGAVAGGRRVVHVSCHSFTPVLDGIERKADIGLLYDPSRPGERELCALWRTTLERAIAPMRVRRNYPYRGENDGLTLHLRRRFGPGSYVGVELEINQKHVRRGAAWPALRRAIVQSFQELAALNSAGGAKSVVRTRAPAQAARSC